VSAARATNGVTTATGYDLLDRVTEVRQQGASSPTGDLVTTYTYSVLGDLACIQLPRGNAIEYAYDAAGRFRPSVLPGHQLIS
jgi:YD repeat-containing protein